VADETENVKSITIKAYRSAKEGERVYIEEDTTMGKEYHCPGDCQNLHVIVSVVPEGLVIKV